MLSVLTLTSVIPLGFFKNKGGRREKKKVTEEGKRGKAREEEGKERKRKGEKKGKGGKGDVQTDFYFHNSVIGQFKGKEGRM